MHNHKRVKRIAEDKLKKTNIAVNLKPYYIPEQWSRKYEKCIGCGTIEITHWARGYCSKCYPKYVLRKTGGFDRDNKVFYKNFMQNVKQKISEKQKIKMNASIKIIDTLNKSMLQEMYHERKMSLGDIARNFGCSRVYIWRLCRQYGINVKTKSEAREDAYNKGKKIRFRPVNKDFFKKWTNEMAYVLGFICADGNIGPRLNTLSISQKEIEILEKIKNIMQAEQNITHYSYQDIHHLAIGSTEMVNDVLKLGIPPNKSLKLKFPNVPIEHINHFIRGYFDGDGSICKSGNCWRVSFTTGSVDFIKSIKENMNKFCLVSEQRIYKHKTANAYNLYYCSSADLNKIYRFFYDECTLNNGLYLTRKYKKFLEALKLTDGICDIEV